jgi:hypothetical protein
MPPPVSPISPIAVRVDAAEPRPWATIRAAGVVHVGRSVVILDAWEHLVVSDSRFGLAPGGIQLGDDEFARFAAWMRTGDRIALEHWTPELVRLADLRVLPRPVPLLPLPAPAEDAAHPMAPGRIRALAPRLATASGTALDETLGALIGAGPGSTPSGDDVVVGVLAGLRASGHSPQVDRVAHRTQALLDRTTSASRMYLRAAAEGRFADRVHQLLEGLASPQAASAAARRAAAWGATSGLDLLAGILAGAAATGVRGVAA